jgi:hypothetical protein
MGRQRTFKTEKGRPHMTVIDVGHNFNVQKEFSFDEASYDGTFEE